MNTKKTTKFSLVIRLICIAALLSAFLPESVFAADTCGTGTWTLGSLEIHHINIGQGDSTLIVGPTGKSLLFDAGEVNWNSNSKAQIIGPYIEGVLGCKSLDYVVISHFHLDHIGYVGYGGLWNLVETQGFTVGNILVRDYNSYLGDTSGTFTNWKTYLEGTGQTTLHPVTAVEGTSQVDLGTGLTFDIVTVDGNGALIMGDFHEDSSPPSENDYSIGAVISFGDFDEWIGGDLDGQYEVGGFGYTYHDIELSVSPEVGDVDVYKVNHHASSHSSNATFINQLDPEVSIVTVGDGNTYSHPTQSIMDRLLATSTVYMTERGDTGTDIGSAIVAGNIVIKTSDGSSYTVNGTAYTATEPTRIDNDGDGYFAETDPDDTDNGLLPSLNGGCGPIYQTCSTSCEVTAGEVSINEVLPAPSSGDEWVELYNASASTINIGYCYIDDIVGGSAAYQIPAGTLIQAHGFWTLDRSSYFNNTGDDARLLKEDASTVLDAYTFGSTGSDLSWYRFPDGEDWASSPTALTTRGQSNASYVPPVVLSVARADPNPSSANSVNFTVTFSKAVTGVNTTPPFDDFALTLNGITGAEITGVSGSTDTYTVAVGTGTGNGTIRLDVVDNDTIKDINNSPLGGSGNGNGNFTAGETYTIDTTIPPLVIPVDGTSLLTLRPLFDWEDAPGVTGYNIQIARDSGFKKSILRVNTTNSVYVPTKDLPKNTALYWRVRAKIGSTYGDWSEVRSFNTPVNPPSIPALSLPKNKALTTDYTPELVWKPVKLASGIYFAHYHVQADDDSDFSSTIIDDSSLTDQFTPKFTPSSDFSPNTTYYWRVRAFNTDGEYSAWSKVYYFRTAIIPPNLLTPNNGNSIGTLQPSFDWSDVPGATGYTIQIARDSAFKKSVLKANTVSSVYTAIKNLPSGTTLYWRVQAKGPNGPSLWSVTFSFVTP